MIRVALSLCLLAASLVDASYFAVMGDWGGEEIVPYYTGAEKKVAAAMDKVVAANNMKFSLAIGDNFYSHGIKDENDPRFKTTFENVFTGAHLQHPFEFKVVGGNHDHYGNITGEVAYTAHSKRWHFPSLYYNFTSTSTDGATVEILMIDTVILAGLPLDTNGNVLFGDQMLGPEDVAAAEDQWSWIEATLATSTADYLIVSGHYPILSVCEHGPTSILEERLLPMMDKYSASAYLAGHDHCAEYLYTGSGIQHHGIGAAHGCDDSLAHASAVPKGSLKFHYAGSVAETFDPSRGAFGTVEWTAKGMTVRHLKDDGSVLYTAPAIAPRKSS